MYSGSREKTQDMRQRKPCSLTRKPNKQQRVNDYAKQRHRREAAAVGTGHRGLAGPVTPPFERTLTKMPAVDPDR